jgi:hypothetical protein
MNIVARIVKLFLRPLFHLFQMETRWSARNVKAGMLKNRFPPFQASCPEAQVMRRQELSPAAQPNRASPEHDILGASLAPFT